MWGHPAWLPGMWAPRWYDGIAPGAGVVGRSKVQRSVARSARWRRARRLGPLMVLVPVMLTAACQKGPFVAQTEPTPEPSPDAQVLIQPEDGAKKWRPDKPIQITAAKGTLESVSVRSADDDEIGGELSADRTSWTSRWTLNPSTSYEVTATAVNPEGRTTTARSSFKTLDPAATIQASSVIAGGQMVGVGMPIVIRFDRPVYNKKNVERSFEVRASKEIEGAWYWMSRQEVHFRPKEYWPADTKVRFIGHLSGVRAAKNVYGVDDLRVKFKIGDRHVTHIDTKKHTMVVRKNGKKVNTFPVSAGKASTPTTSGTHVAFEKSPTTIMDSATVGIPKGSPGYYRITTHWTVKFTFSGLYTHSMDSTTWAQGSTNVSHGCINMTTSRAKWFYDFSMIGDVIKVTGTSRPLEWGNGWTAWEKSWKDWVKGSAFNAPINPETGIVEPKPATPSASPSDPPSSAPSSTP